MNRCVVYGPCSLGVVSVLSVGVSGIRTEKRPSSELNFTHPASFGSTVVRGVAAGPGLGGRRVCAWATAAALRTSVINKRAQNRFIDKIPFKSTERPTGLYHGSPADDTNLNAL